MANGDLGFYAIETDESPEEREVRKRKIAQQAAERLGIETPDPSMGRLAGTVERLRKQGASDEEIRRLLRNPQIIRAAATYGGKEVPQPKVPDYPESYHQAVAEEKIAAGIPLTAEGVMPSTGPGQQPPAAQAGLGMAFNLPGIPGTGALREYRKQLSEHQKEYQKAYTEASKLYTRAAADQKAAAWATADAEIAQQEAQAAVLGNAAAKSLEFQGRLADVEKQRKQYIDQQVGKLDQAVQRFQEMRIDPYRLFRNSDGSTNYPRKVTAAIAVFLGALGERMQGRGGNPALEVIERSIERDIAAQQADLQKAQADIGIQFNVLGAMREVFGDERSAVLASKALMWEHAKLELQHAAAEAETPAIAARAQQAVADIGAKEVELRTQLEMSANETATQLVGAQAGLAAQETQLGMQRAQLGMQRAGMMAQALGKQEDQHPIKGFEAFRQVDKEERKEARKLADSYGPVLQTINKLVEMRNDVGAEMWPAYVSENTARLETLRQDLLMKVKEAYQLGALQEHEMVFMEKMIPDATSLGNVIPQLEVMRGQFVQEYTDKMYNRGLQPKGWGPPVEGARKR